MKKFTLEEVKNQIKELNPNIELLSDSYKDCMTNMDFKCNICGSEWKTRLTNIKQGTGCPDCGMQKSIKTGKDRSFNLDKIKELAKEYKPNLIILSEEYPKKSEKALVKCSDCGYEWEMQWRKIYEKSNKKYCPCCSGKVVSDLNRVSIVRPELVKYFKNPTDAHDNSIGTRNKVEIKCPDCGNEVIMCVSDLTRKPFSCRKCSDGLSKGEKFIFSFLKQLGVPFETQKRFPWLKSRSYDFYIPSENTIIEVFGEQHYRPTGFKNKSFEEEVANDKLKKGTALNNGIKNYIILNYSKSDLNLLKEDTIEQMGRITDISKINFIECMNYCSSSNINIAWELYENKYSINKIAQTMKMDRKTIRNYIKIAKEIHSV